MGLRENIPRIRALDTLKITTAISTLLIGPDASLMKTAGVPASAAGMIEARSWFAKQRAARGMTE